MIGTPLRGSRPRELCDAPRHGRLVYYSVFVTWDFALIWHGSRSDQQLFTGIAGAVREKTLPDPAGTDIVLVQCSITYAGGTLSTQHLLV